MTAISWDKSRSHLVATWPSIGSLGCFAPLQAPHLEASMEGSPIVCVMLTYLSFHRDWLLGLGHRDMTMVCMATEATAEGWAGPCMQ